MANKLNNMPASFLLNLGFPLNNNILDKQEKLQKIKNLENINFPLNIFFKQENYIKSFKTEQKYDTIVCLNTSKRIHLNYGDTGIKLLFTNVYNQLNEGGLFIFEPQNFKSYKKRKNMNSRIKTIFSEINLKPEHFEEYLTKIYNFELISSETPPSNSKKIYNRPIFVFKKN